MPGPGSSKRSSGPLGGAETVHALMDRPLVARASATIDAPAARVWDALVDPATIRRYMFGTTVISDWTEGSPIVWKGEWKGKAYEDTGVIVRLERGRVLRYSHFSPLSGLPNTPRTTTR